ncbi:ribonuclease [Actibacterium mucosum KCTC 23349]|uniref:Ribonuclease E n=1 Tax=Actibacterium mucosum KCTC 23349 TaxID=1454373 RepID=A0A037ZMA9_9RHOB|nr:ribonuclease E/G [Actibacterium mucosum]KAJ56784.1 ribonuclease [Actibacterium mucosum KCTC 23349]
MAKKMLIDATHAEECRVVVVDGNKVDEFDFESVNKRQLAGNIYLAKVTRVEPSLQAAFVDYGGNRHGFLAFSEIHPDYYQIPVADREALIAEELAYAKAQAEEDEKPTKSRRSRSRSRSRSKSKTDASKAKADAAKAEQAKTDEVKADETKAEEVQTEEVKAEEAVEAPATVEAPSSMDVVDLGDETPDDDTPPETIAAAIESDEDAVTSGDVDEPEAEEETAEADGEDAPEPVAEAAEATPDAEDTAEEVHEAPAEDVTEDVAEDVTEAPAEPTVETPAAEDTVEEAAQEGEEPAEVEAKTSSDDDDAVEEDNGEESGEDDTPLDASEKDSDIESVADEDVTEEIRQPRKPRPKRYKIQEVIKVRQILLVQVVKEERGNKGAALTTYLSLAGRYCVLMPNTARGGGISRKITNATDRKKLKEIAGEIEVPQGAGLIIRTAGAKRTKSEIKRDYEYLQRLWEQVRELTLKSIAPAPIYEEGNLIKRSIRDLYNRDIDEVLVEGEAGYRVAKDFMKMIMPSHAKNVKHYTDPLPLFARYQVESYLGQMFNPTVQLKSGGYIVIGVTEALVAIDVNSGRATKEGSIEETALKTNLEAADEVARQLRLRDLAGLIVIDFIDMEEKRNNTAVEKRMKDKLKTDRARIQVGRISGFGLMEMSRQRLRPGMIEATTQPCPHCHGTGLIRSDDNLSLTILRQLEEEGVRGRSKEVLLKAPVAVANYLINQKREHLAQIEARYGISVRVEADPHLVSPDYSIERFKTATRNVPEPSTPVVSLDMSDLPEVVEEAEEAPAAETNEDAPAPKKRRRRRRRKKSGSNGENGSTGGNGEQAEEGKAEDTDAASEAAPEATTEATPEAKEDAPAEPVAEDTAPEEKAPDVAVEEPAGDAAVEDAPVEEVAPEDTPVEDPAPEEAAAEEESVAVDAAPDPEPEPEPEPVAEAAPEPEPEPVAEEPKEPEKPKVKRRGWWSLQS